MRSGGNLWVEMSDRRMAARMKGKLYKMGVRPAKISGLGTVALTKRQELEVTELKVLGFSYKYIRETAQVEWIGN